jgi:uncharacterized protein
MDDFRPVELTDKPVFDQFLAEEQPGTSELTFTNLFMWRRCYRTVWRVWNGVILLILHEANGEPFGMPPVGRGDKAAALEVLVSELRALKAAPRVTRVGEDFVHSFADPERYQVIEDRDNSDYVYLARDLIDLTGKKFHRKKNHLNKFIKNYSFEYAELTPELVGSFLELQEAWCELKNCVQNEGLSDEHGAIYEALSNYTTLGFRGGAIVIDSKVEAFAIGEMLNSDTAVIHVEKANPDVPGIYAAINQQFCQAAWSQAKYINREQDLGLESLKKAKESYNPHHMVDKFVLIPKD